MKLYHVSVDTNVIEREFVPRIPDLGDNAKGAEDNTIPRVCFSETVDGCISALPKYSRNLVNSKNAKFVLYEIDTDDYPFEYFLSNKEIVKEGLVYDANLTKEWWLLEPLKLHGSLCGMMAVEAEPILNFSLIGTNEIIATARFIDDKFPVDEALIQFEKQFGIKNSQDCFDAINRYASIYGFYDICDELFDSLAEQYKEAQTWKYKVHYKYLPNRCKNLSDISDRR